MVAFSKILWNLFLLFLCIFSSPKYTYNFFFKNNFRIKKIVIGNQRPRTLVVGWPQWGRNGGSVNELLVRQKMFLWQMKLIVNNFSTRSVFILRSTKKQYKVDQQLLLSIFFFFFKFNCPKYYPKKKIQVFGCVSKKS